MQRYCAACDINTPLKPGMWSSKAVLDLKDGSRTKNCGLALASKTIGLGLDVLASNRITHM